MRHVASPTNDAYSRVRFITWPTLERIERRIDNFQISASSGSNNCILFCSLLTCIAYTARLFFTRPREQHNYNSLRNTRDFALVYYFSPKSGWIANFILGKNSKADLEVDIFVWLRSQKKKKKKKRKRKKNEIAEIKQENSSYSTVKKSWWTLIDFFPSRKARASWKPRIDIKAVARRGAAPRVCSLHQSSVNFSLA